MDKKVDPPFLRTAFNYDRNLAGDESGLKCPEPTMAQQHFAEECDINTIVRRFGLTGELPTNVRLPSYGDFDNVIDFQTAMQAVVQAETDFMTLPAELRARFGHDPQQLLMFLADDKNRDEAVKLGLVATPPSDTKPPEPAKPA